MLPAAVSLRPRADLAGCAAAHAGRSRVGCLCCNRAGCTHNAAAHPCASPAPDGVPQVCCMGRLDLVGDVQARERASGVEAAHAWRAVAGCTLQLAPYTFVLLATGALLAPMPTGGDSPSRSLTTSCRWCLAATRTATSVSAGRPRLLQSQQTAAPSAAAG